MTKKNRGKAEEDFLGQDRQQPLRFQFCHPVSKMGTAKYHFAYGSNYD